MAHFVGIEGINIEHKRCLPIKAVNNSIDFLAIYAVYKQTSDKRSNWKSHHLYNGIDAWKAVTNKSCLPHLGKCLHI